MSQIDNVLKVLSIILSLCLVVLSINACFTHVISIWILISTFIFCHMLLYSLYNTYKYSTVNVFNLIGMLLATLTLGRLFSTIHFEKINLGTLDSLDPLMIAETGPGVDSIMYLSTILFVVITIQVFRQPFIKGSIVNSKELSLYEWALTLVRFYVGMMFVAHFTGHILAGPIPFAVFEHYFASIGLPFANFFVILAGLIEISLAIMLSFGLLTRLAAFGSIVYLFVSVGLGGHFSAGYVWVLPKGGWEFPALWIFTSGIFLISGGGEISIDSYIKKKLINNNRKFKMLFI